MNTTLDQIIEINNGEPAIKENVPMEYYQKGIYQWWHDVYGCIYVGISAVDTENKKILLFYFPLLLGEFLHHFFDHL